MEPQAYGHIRFEGRLRYEREARCARRVGGEHRPVQDRLRRRNGGVGIAHCGTGDHAALQHQLGFDAEEGRLPEHQVSQFADFDGADQMTDPVRNGRIDRVLGDVAFDATVVVRGRITALGQCTPLDLHLVGRLPGAQNDLSDATHRLRVG